MNRQPLNHPNFDYGANKIYQIGCYVTVSIDWDHWKRLTFHPLADNLNIRQLNRRILPNRWTYNILDWTKMSARFEELNQDLIKWESDILTLCHYVLTMSSEFPELQRFVSWVRIRSLNQVNTLTLACLVATERHELVQLVCCSSSPLNKLYFGIPCGRVTRQHTRLQRDDRIRQRLPADGFNGVRA